MPSHEEKQAQVVDQMWRRQTIGEPLVFQKKEISHFVPNPYSDKDKLTKVDFRAFDELLEIDVKAKTATAEPGLPFCKLVEETLARGLMPVVVPELKTITVGGAVSGCSIESQSYRYGGFHDSCLEYEVVTGTGEVLTCSPAENADVFHLMHGSYGTLGRITKLTFQLMPAKPFIKLEYRLHTNFADYWKDLTERCEKGDYQFIDGIIHDRQHFVLVLGNFVSEAPYTSNYEWLDIYYKATLDKREDYLATYDYFFRYDTECHWLTKSIPPLENKLVRLAVGKIFLGSSNLIRWSGRLREVMKLKKRQDVVVDVFIPGKRFEEFFRWYERDFDFFPLWIVPYKMKEIYPWVSDEYQERMGDTFLIDAAVYGKPNMDPKVDYSELLEKKVFELGGVKTLISCNHYDEQTFWKIYSKPRISAMKKRLDPNNLFGHLYDKFKPERYR